jgi:serine/threonine-protein kinase
MMRALHPDGHPATAVFESQRGGALVALGRYAEAEPILLRSHEALVEGFGAEHSFVANARERLVALYEGMGRPEDAARWRG